MSWVCLDRWNTGKIFLFLAGGTLLLKGFLASLGHNFDVESYEIVADLVLGGKSVYAHTERYNYGPIWFGLLAMLRQISLWLPLSEGRENFHIWVALFLGLVDIGMAAVLRLSGYARVGTLFLLNPITWLISGFHSQFDQLPILFGLLAVLLLMRESARPSLKTCFGVAVLLGLSLVTKHCLIFLPLWLGFYFWQRYPGAWLESATILIAPVLVFLWSFLPWFFDEASRTGILANVFLYKSDHLYALLPKALGVLRITPILETVFGGIPVFGGYKFLWLVATVALGWRFRRRTPLELLALNTVTLIVFSPALSDQYLVIPVLACSLFYSSPWTWAYTAISSVFLVGFSPANLATIPAMADWRAWSAAIPWRRYGAVIFLAIFLAREAWPRPESASSKAV